MNAILKKKEKELKALCQKYRVERLYAFGSVTGDQFDPDKSDLDFIVAFQPGLDPITMGGYLWDMQEELEAMFNRKVDLLYERPFRNPYFAKAVEESKKLLYAAA